ncbi:MAG: hypothetical protein BGO43_00785 [Gammaproteobacteria bacterium 39-13]|nr:DUF1398 family protein [Gammaproteobacteria bacterium]OJV96791.1 MAG: hypothetical protein BGO43_00785 [Gammaproteobacteria bacterium 39-13]
MINIAVIQECTDKKLPFPEVIKHLTEIGIERYYTDLTKMEKIFYAQNGETYTERLLIDSMPKMGENFNKDKIIETLREIQRGEIDYSTFIRRIVSFGTVSYTVYIDGKHVVYVGRKGETYIEHFPF